MATCPPWAHTRPLPHRALPARSGAGSCPSGHSKKNRSLQLLYFNVGGIGLERWGGDGGQVGQASVHLVRLLQFDVVVVRVQADEKRTRQAVAMHDAPQF